MGLFIKPNIVKQALSLLKCLPKNQTALFYFMIFAKTPRISRRSEIDGEGFEKEFYKYFGGPIRGGGVAVFDPFGAEWRAENYTNSTVYGRLLSGNHGWTEGSEAYFKRTPSGGGWPATFSLFDDGFDTLKTRSSPPCLKYEYRLPLAALAIYYYRFSDLSAFGPKNIQELCSLYKREVLSINPRLTELVIGGPNFPVDLFQEHSPSEAEMLGCYPPSPFSTEEKTREWLYKDDIAVIKGRLKLGEQTADYVRLLLKKEKF